MVNGRFAWHDLRTSDVDGAKAFYSALLGWDISGVPMGEFEYQMLNASGVPIGGIAPNDPGADSSWVSYVATEDIDAAIAKLNGAGGSTISGPHDLPGIGRLSYHRDPDGLEFALFQGEGDWSDRVMPLSGAPSGVPSWHEIVTTDADAACAWYGDQFGWSHQVWDMGGFNYHGLLIGDAPVVGVYTAEAGGTPKGWVIYFEAPGSIDEALASIPDLGGRALTDKMTVPGTGSFLVAADPTGAIFGILDSESMEE